MSKVYADFDAKLVAYGRVQKAYDDLYALWKAQGFPAGKIAKQIDGLAMELDKLRGPLHTALNKLALAVI